MFNTTYLSNAIHHLLLEAFEDETISRDETRMIIVGPNGRGDVLHIWAAREWESYAEPSEGDEFANISLAPWLDEVDEVQRAMWNDPAPSDGVDAQLRRSTTHAVPEVDIAISAKLGALRDLVVGALREVATSEVFSGWGSVLGFFSVGLSSSGYADLVAFAHPDGGGELLPIQEERPPSVSIYSTGTLTERGITMFYPEGEKDGLDDESDADASWASFAFDDMEMIRFDDYRDKTIVRMTGELFDRTFCHGHTHEEWGGPDAEQVDCLIRKHLRTRPELLFDVEACPDVTDTAAMDRWMSRYLSCNLTEARSIVGRLADDQGLGAVPLFLDRLPETVADRESALARFADKLVGAHRFAEALDLIEGLSGKNRVLEGSEEVRCLIALGRNEDCLARIKSIGLREKQAVHHMAPFKAIALTNLGRSDEAQTLLEPLLVGKQRHVDLATCFYALAHAKRHSDRAEAEALAYRSMSKGNPPSAFASIDFADCPELLKLFARREQLEADGERFDADLTAMTRRTDGVALTTEESMPASEEQWALGQQLEVEGVSRMKNLVVAGRYAFAPAQTDGLVVFDLEEPRAPRVVTRLESETSFESAAIAGQFLYVADYSHGLKVVDVSEPTSPRVLGCAPRFFSRGHGSLAVGEGVAVTGGGCTMDLYDLTVPEAPVLASSLELGMKRGNLGGVNGLQARGTTIFVAAGGTGLVILDATDPSSPRVLGQLALRSGFYARTIALHGDTVVLGDSSESWLIDVSDLRAPGSIGIVPRSLVGTGVVVLDESFAVLDSRGGVWSVGNGDFAIRELAMRVDPSGAEREVDDVSDAALVGDVLLTIAGARLSAFTREPRTSTAGVRCADVARIEALSATLASWVDAQLRAVAEQVPDASVGVLVLRRWGSRFSLLLATPRSVLELDHGVAEGELPCPEAALSTFLAAGAAAIGISEDAEPEGIDGQDSRDYSDAVGKAWDAVLESVAKGLATSDALESVAAGRILICTESHRGIRVVELRLDASKPWQPERTELRERTTKSIEEMLSAYDSYKYADLIEGKAREDDATRAEVFRLARLGMWSALRIVSALKDLDEAAALEAFIEASAVRLDTRVLELLAGHKDRDAVRSIFERAYEDDNPHIKIAAAKILGRCDEDAIVALVRGLLENTGGGYAEAELAAEAMEGMTTRLPDMRASLGAWVSRAGAWENRLPLIAKYLFGAGEPTLPAMVAEQAGREVRDEQYHSMKLGIKALDRDWDQHEACATMRLWTGKQLAQRVIELHDADDHSASLYPPDAELEPYQASWGYLLAAAWPHLEAHGSIDWFVDGLIERARPGLEYEADRHLLLTILNNLFQAQDMASVVRVARAILSAPDDVYDERTRRSLKKKYYLARLQMGWDLLNERNLQQARHIANAAMEDEPSDGQVRSSSMPGLCGSKTRLRAPLRSWQGTCES